jgi:hypothetical protein
MSLDARFAKKIVSEPRFGDVYPVFTHHANFLSFTKTCRDYVRNVYVIGCSAAYHLALSNVSKGRGGLS